MSGATGALTAAAFGRSLKAEALKAAGLPGVWLGTALALALPVVVEYINDRDMSSKASAQGAGAPGGLSDASIASIVFGTTGIVVLAACVMVSEYTRDPRTSGASRQVVTTMLVAPRRGACVAAKLVVVVGAATALLALTTAVAFAVARHELCSWAPFSPIPWHRLAGLLAWWLFSATASMALAVATRSALVSMTALIAMSTAIAPGALLIRSADAARKPICTACVHVGAIWSNPNELPLSSFWNADSTSAPPAAQVTRSVHRSEGRVAAFTSSLRTARSHKPQPVGSALLRCPRRSHSCPLCSNPLTRPSSSTPSSRPPCSRSPTPRRRPRPRALTGAL